MNSELLYNQLYERTADFGRTQFIKELMRLERENNQLKEQLEKKYEKTGTLTTEILYEENTKLQSVLKELRTWLEELGNCDIYTSEILSKLNELEGIKDEKV